MALKLPDSAVPMGDFPVAKAVDIDFDDGENLQEKLDNGSLGSGGTGGAGGIYTNTPIGTVLSFAGLTPPNGYLLCDGRSYVVADYQDLYDVIGNTYGGDSANFNVPNLIDKFIQGSDRSGIEKEAGLPNITGEVGYLNAINGGNHKEGINVKNGCFEYSRNSMTSPETSKSAQSELDTDGITGLINFNANRSNSIYGNSNTVQPPALTMVYIIKAFHTNEGVDSSVELEDNVVNHINNRIENKVNEKVDELFQSVSDGKTLVANAITDKGVSTSTTATFATMATNIGKINVYGYKEETASYNNTSTTANRLTFTFSADISGVKQITPPSDISTYIVPETLESMLTINGKKLTLYANGVGTWKVTAMVNNA